MRQREVRKADLADTSSLPAVTAGTSEAEGEWAETQVRTHRASGQLKASRARSPPPRPAPPTSAGDSRKAECQVRRKWVVCMHAHVCVCARWSLLSKNHVASPSVTTPARWLVLWLVRSLRQPVRPLRRKEPGSHSSDTHVPVCTGRTAAHSTKSTRSATHGAACLPVCKGRVLLTQLCTCAPCPGGCLAVLEPCEFHCTGMGPLKRQGGGEGRRGGRDERREGRGLPFVP